MNLDPRTLSLLALASIPALIACPADDQDGESSHGDAAGETADAQAGTDDGSTGTADAPSSTDAGTTDADAPAEGSSSDADDGLECGEPRPVGELDPICFDFARHLDECEHGGSLPDRCLDAYASSCQLDVDDYAAAYGDACGQALLDFFACLSEVECEALGADDPCPAQATAFELACNES